jgi:hypothetical protein
MKYVSAGIHEWQFAEPFKALKYIVRPKEYEYGQFANIRWCRESSAYSSSNSSST